MSPARVVAALLCRDWGDDERSGFTDAEAALFDMALAELVESGYLTVAESLTLARVGQFCGEMTARTWLARLRDCDGAPSYAPIFMREAE